jgi:hypothetical protein
VLLSSLGVAGGDSSITVPGIGVACCVGGFQRQAVSQRPGL